jgi:hypothetical protein
MSAAAILFWTDWRELVILILLTKIQMKTQETLNTQCAVIFLRFSTNICVACSDKQSNNYGHWKTAPIATLSRILETDSMFEHGRSLVQEQNQNNKPKEK